MAIYTGFFDASFDESTGTYDNSYDSADFTGYFGEIVGSGVCVQGNDNSMQVYYDAASNRAVINPGYLFIRGYWLKNDGLYTVNLAGLGAGTYAIYAQLNLGTRGISIGQMAKADPETYPDALVLAYATLDGNGAVTIEDTRSRTDICGLIDSAGSMSNKINYAINYIDTEINTKLEQVEQTLQSYETEISGKIDEANDLISQIAPPAIGTIKFSASKDVDSSWLRCDGAFINEQTYPELVAALGKLYPSNDKFHLLSTETVSKDISNSVILNGRLWVFSCQTLKLYGIDVDGDSSVKEITLAGDEYFNLWQPESDNPICLSIIQNLTNPGQYRIFIVQFNDDENYSAQQNLLVYSGDFDPDGDQITLSRPFDVSKISPGLNQMPYVISEMVSGVETFYMVVYYPSLTSASLSNLRAKIAKWTNTQDSLTITDEDLTYAQGGYTYSKNFQYRSGYNPKNSNEFITPYLSLSGTSSSSSSWKIRPSIISKNKGIYKIDPPDYGNSFSDYISDSIRSIAMVAGDNSILLQFDLTGLAYAEKTAGNTTAINRISTNISCPEYAKVFAESAVYLRNKSMFLIFVGTGIVFSRDLSEGSFGYLDTTSVLGIIYRYGELRYDEDAGTVYIIGQDSTNKVKAAKLVLNNLFNYSNDGAWLPLIASDGVPAYIKATD